MTADPYATLGLTRTATTADIRKAYRKLVRTSHPDLNPDDTGAETRFKAISGAHDLLKDPKTRAKFDAGQIDSNGAERPPRQRYRDFADTPGNAYRTTQGFAPGIDPGEVFAEILRQRGQTSGGGASGGSASGGGASGGGASWGNAGFAAPGPDLRFTLETGFLDAARGADLPITLPGGASLAVRIPRGAQQGQTLRLRGKGGPGYGKGPAGDALITLSVRPHPVFQREGHDILVTLPITIDEAVLGGKVTAPTIEGPVSVTIPAGASTGRILRLRGRGIASQPTPGDQLIELKIVTPPVIDDALRAFLTTWRTDHPHDPRTNLLNEAAT